MAIATEVHEIDPLNDERWVPFLEEHNLATLFHSPEWLGALHRTYGYRAGALVTSSDGDRLTNAVVFCRVRSWLTGRRLVSIPFSDHCTPLVANGEEFSRLLSRLKDECDGGRERYLEIRSAAVGLGAEAGIANSASSCLHRLDLRPNLSELFNALHESCIRRKIARALREGVSFEEEMSEELLQKFYQLTVLTRRRHRIPPQPLSWFRNLIDSFGGKAKIRLASFEGQPAAGILTIRYKTTMTYKYGCSDPRFHSLGPMQLLIWSAIREAKGDGLLELDMGRTDWNNEGLLTFKDRWGGARSVLTYLRYPSPKTPRPPDGTAMRIAKLLFTVMPTRVQIIAGRVMYPHID